jgi:hypothetical protein
VNRSAVENCSTNCGPIMLSIPGRRGSGYTTPCALLADCAGRTWRQTQALFAVPVPDDKHLHGANGVFDPRVQPGAPADGLLPC